jgi:hypothetical protein
MELEMRFVKEKGKVVWKGPSVLGGVQGIEIKTDTAFGAALLGLRYDGGDIIEGEGCKERVISEDNEEEAKEIEIALCIADKGTSKGRSSSVLQRRGR